MSKIVALAGPTAVGKTEFAIKLAEELDGEIVSCDSMQLYKYMDIGSAKPTPEEMRRARHHLVDIIDPREDFSVAQYQKLAKDAISDILSRGRLPIISGGTGLYLNSLLYDMDFSSSPERAASLIHPNNTKKIIRALERLKKGEEIVRQFSDIRTETSDYDVILIGLTRNRDQLYDRINKRVDALVEQGLFQEVQKLAALGLTADNISMKGIGYKEIFAYLDGRYTMEDAIDKIKKNTRHYAKKQLTWFRRYGKMEWCNISDFDSDEDAAEEVISWVRKSI